MYFAKPIFLWFLTIPIVYLILRMIFVRLRVQIVPSLLLWTETPEEKSIAKGRFRIPPSVILQTIALVFSALAITEPHIYSRGQKFPDVHIFFDNSASCSSFETSQGKTRFEVLKDECGTLLENLPPESKVFFYFLQEEEKVVMKMQSKGKSSLNILNTIQPTTQNDELLTKYLLTTFLEKDAETIFYVFSDKNLLPEDIHSKNINYILYGRDSSNVAIEFVEAKNIKPQGLDIKIFLKNFSEKDIRGSITLITENRILFTQNVFSKTKTTNLLSTTLQGEHYEDIEVRFESVEDNLSLDNYAKILKDEPYKYYVVATDDLPDVFKKTLLKMCEPAIIFVSKEASTNFDELTVDKSTMNIFVTQGEIKQNLLESKQLNKFIIFSPLLLEGIFFSGTNEDEIKNFTVQDENFVRYIDTSKIKFTGIKNVVFQNPDISVKKILSSESKIPLIFIIKKQGKEFIVLNFSLSKSLIQDMPFEKHPYFPILMINILQHITNYRFNDAVKEKIVYNMRDEMESDNFGTTQNYPLKKLDYERIEYTMYEKNITVFLVTFSVIFWLCGIILEEIFKR